nr:MAG TPA: Flavivirus DEAD domain [Siphoviridae sp. ctkTc5]DAX52797.1 MAG TPA: Flavivirus DEAD domain [Caudoviricetes sp.]
MKASKSANLNKEQFNELKDELGTIQTSVNNIREVGEDNNKKISEVNNKLIVHDEAHLVTMYLRLERDMTSAIQRGYTTVHESDIIHKMHKNYKKLGGNGYIDSLYNKYNILEVRN